MKKIYVFIIISCIIFLTCCKSSKSSFSRDKLINAFDQVADSLQISENELVKQSYKFSSDDLVKVDSSQEDIIKAAKATALFIKNIIVSGFNIDGIIEDVVVNTPDQDFVIRLKVSSKKESNEINAIFNAIEEDEECIYYINFIIDYDYDKNLLNSFTVYDAILFYNNHDNDYCEYFSYKNDELFGIDKTVSNYSNYVEFVKNEQKEYESLQISEKQHDYTREYMKAMNIVFGDYNNIDIDSYKKEKENKTIGKGEYTINLSCKDSNVSIIPSNDIAILHANEYNLVIYNSLDSIDLNNPSSWNNGSENITDFTNYVFIYHFKVKLDEESELENIELSYNFKINSTSNINTFNVVMSSNNGNVETNLRYEKSSEEKLISLIKNEETDVTLYIFLNGEDFVNATYSDYLKMCNDDGTIEIELIH